MKSTNRPDYRYIYFQIIGAELNQNRIERIILEMIGVVASIKAQPRVVSIVDNQVIVRCIRGEEEIICAGLALVSNVDGVQIRLNVKRISGTIRSIELKSKIKVKKRTKRVKSKKK